MGLFGVQSYDFSANYLNIKETFKKRGLVLTLYNY